jgi:hypothetical protein
MLICLVIMSLLLFNQERESYFIICVVCYDCNCPWLDTFVILILFPSILSNLAFWARFLPAKELCEVKECFIIYLLSKVGFLNAE